MLLGSWDLGPELIISGAMYLGDLHRQNETTIIIICDLIMILRTLWENPLLYRDWSGSTDQSYEASHLST